MMAAKKTKKKPPSIHIKLQGERTPAELVDMLLQAMGQLEELPFELYKNCNFYVTPVQAGPKILDTILIDGTYSCAADNRGI